MLDGLSLDGRLMGNRTFGAVTGLEAGAVTMGKLLEVVTSNMNFWDGFATDFIWAFCVCTL